MGLGQSVELVEMGVAALDGEEAPQCLRCGACILQCPFEAVT